MVIIRGKQQADGWVDFIVTTKQRRRRDGSIRCATELTGWTRLGQWPNAGERSWLVVLVRVILGDSDHWQVVSQVNWLRHDVDCVGIDGVGRRRRVEVGS